MLWRNPVKSSGSACCKHIHGTDLRLLGSQYQTAQYGYQTIGVVGGLVLGQAAVSAGIVSNVMVIVVAMTGMASFIIPNQEVALAIRLVRFPIIFLAAGFGIVGIGVGGAILLSHLISLDSLGRPFMIPFFPFSPQDFRDALIITPAVLRSSRPKMARPLQYRRKKG